MSFYGPTDTWKIVYTPRELSGGRRGVALIEASNRQSAIYNFRRDYEGEFSTVDSCTKLVD